MESPLSPGALPAANIVGGLPSSCAKARSSMATTLIVQAHRERNNAFDVGGVKRAARILHTAVMSGDCDGEVWRAHAPISSSAISTTLSCSLGSVRATIATQ